MESFFTKYPDFYLIRSFIVENEGKKEKVQKGL